MHCDEIQVNVGNINIMEKGVISRVVRTIQAVVALDLGGPCVKYLGDPFPMCSTQNLSGPFHAKMS